MYKSQERYKFRH